MDRPRLLLRHHWPLAVLLASIGLTSVAAFDAQRVVRSQRQLAERALTDYANFAAWSFAQHLSAYLHAAEQEVLGPVNHGSQLHMNPEIPAASALPQLLPMDSACGCHRTTHAPSPDAFVEIDLKTGAATADLNGAVADVDDKNVYRMRMEAADEPTMLSMPMMHVSNRASPLPNALRWVGDSVSARVRARPASTTGFGLLVVRDGGAPHAITFTAMPTAWADTIVYAATYAEPTLRSIFASVVDDRALLPAAFTAGRRNRQLLVIAVHDRDGRVLFASDSAMPRRLVARTPLSLADDSMTVEAAIRPEMAGALLIGGVPASRLPFSLGLLAIAATLSIIALVQVRRDGELTRIRSEFVSSVSHELRTPIAQIRLFVDTLRLGRARSAEERDWALANVERETTRLGHLVENVLRFSSFTNADAAIAPAAPALASVRALVGEFTPLAAASRATLVVDGDPDAGVRMQRDTLRHIVWNLLDNAVKYGPADQTVRVSVERRGALTAIVVEDEGDGIDAAERDAIWRAFTRGSRGSAKGGSGLGLTIVRQLAEAHGGAATVESTPRGGARFIVTLPDATTPDAEPST